MTSEQAEALGRRWIAAGGGVPNGSMLRSQYRAIRVHFTSDEGRTFRDSLDAEWMAPYIDGWIDLRDAATRGAALEVVRERWGILIYLHSIADPHHGWAMYSAGLNRPVRPMVRGDTEAEALVAALEAAPKETK